MVDMSVKQRRVRIALRQSAMPRNMGATKVGGKVKKHDCGTNALERRMIGSRGDSVGARTYAGRHSFEDAPKTDEKKNVLHVCVSLLSHFHAFWESRSQSQLKAKKIYPKRDSCTTLHCFV